MVPHIEALLDKLNPEQRKAATLGKQSSLILSVAGSGKTSTLTTRIAYLVDELHVPQNKILAVTFTNKAAKEMLGRLDKIGIAGKNLWVGTFHGICNRIMRDNIHDTGYKKGFNIMDSQEQLSFLKRVMKNHDYDTKMTSPENIQYYINQQKEHGIRATRAEKVSTEERIYGFYENACKLDNCVDFSELLLNCYELFLNKPHILDHYSNKFEYVLVDEFQDTNKLQYKWLKQISSVHKCIFAVGDDDQCLPKGTLVSTPQGEIAIENIQVGQEVYSKVGKYLVINKVNNKFENQLIGDLIKITFENGQIVSSTPEHTWFTFCNKKINLKNRVILTLCDVDKEKSTLHSLSYTTNNLDYSELLSKSGLNFTISTNTGDWADTFQLYSNNYGDLVDKAHEIINLLKHNTDNINFQAKVHHRVMDQTWASHILPGMMMIDKEGKEQIVAKVEKIKTNTTIYDLNIENTHNFFANGICTHNSIYSFRGAEPKNMKQFLTDFDPVEVIKLEKNYRSYGNILKAANSIIAKNQDRQIKELKTELDDGEKICYYEAYNDQEEAGFIAEKIKQHRRKQIPFKEMAILYRTNAQSRNLEKALTAHNIPFVIYGGFRFFDRQEVKHAMAYLRLVHNENDNMAFLRVINFPTRGIGSTTVNKIEQIATEKQISLWQATELIEGKAREKVEEFKQIIVGLQNTIKKSKLPLQVERVLEFSGLEDHYKKDNKDGPERLDNLYELISAAEVFIQEEQNSSIDDFLSFSSLESDINSTKRNDTIDAVKLMTVHAAKGLEFELVFISGLDDGLFPHGNNTSNPASLEEERRLMYVAVTRAKQYLFLTRAEERLIHGQREAYIRSRFLSEIPKNLIDDVR